ncbi:MAG: NAD(P)H-hydrate epimerase [Micrococcales bacterium]|nr:NAD(P)H-hydrate epimerase [Micrococcales bacterium]
MRRAASGLAAELRRELAEHPVAEVVLLAGSGDNGGDGLFAVAELAAAGVPVRVLAVGSRLHEEGAAAARAAGAVVDGTAADDPEALAASLGESVLLVDAILGIGATGAGLRGRAHNVVAALLAARDGSPRHRTVAVDVPSGIGVDDGAVPADGVVLAADLTVTFGGVKIGLLLPPASAVAGEVRLIDIGLGGTLGRSGSG